MKTIRSLFINKIGLKHFKLAEILNSFSFIGSVDPTCNSYYACIQFYILQYKIRELLLYGITSKLENNSLVIIERD